ncbi:MAG: hypothetical protein ACR2Q4_10220 [Geminicoccaceae bacterium]
MHVSSCRLLSTFWLDAEEIEGFVLDGCWPGVEGEFVVVVEWGGVSVRHFFADGAYDGDPIYETVRRYQSGDDSTIIIPPRRTATLSDNVDSPTERDRHIMMSYEHGRMVWQKAANYGCRSLVETAFGRYRSIIGDSLSARDDDAQVAEVAIGIKALNRMIRTAKPISVRV